VSGLSAGRWLGGAAVAALAVVAVLPFWRSSGPPGTFGVHLRAREGALSRVNAGDTLAAGDTLRFEVHAPEKAFVTIAGIDAAMVVRPYVVDMELAAGTNRILPANFILEEPDGPERIVGLFCREPIRRDVLIRAGERALARSKGDPVTIPALDLDGCSETSLLIQKTLRRPSADPNQPSAGQ